MATFRALYGRRASTNACAWVERKKVDQPGETKKRQAKFIRFFPFPARFFVRSFIDLNLRTCSEKNKKTH